MSEPFWTPLGGQPVDYEGAWAAGTQYAPGDVVTYNGVTYLAVNPSLGVPPPVALMPSSILHADATLLDHTNTAAEIDLFNYTIPAGTLTNPGRLELYMSGDVLYNVGSVVHRLRAYLGGTLFWDTSWSAGTVANIRHPWEMWLTLSALGALDSIWPVLRWQTEQTDGAAPTVGLGKVDMRADFLIEGGMGSAAAPVAVDMASAQALRVTSAWASASASLSMRRRIAQLARVA